MTDSTDAPMSLAALVQYALEQGLRQVEAAGSPLHPFLVTEGGSMVLLFDPSGQADPMTMAMTAIRGQEQLATAQRLAIVLDTRITLADAPRSDAILVLACERGGGEGQTWAHRYRPKGLFRRFRVIGEALEVGTSKNLFDEALATAGAAPAAGLLAV